MTPPVIAVAGLSGIGKTTLLGRVTSELKIQVLQASALIREGREQQGDKLAVDTLRQRNIDENQQFLLRGFEANVDATAKIIALDCHTIIELPDDIKRIDPGVFAVLRLSGMVYLTDDPVRIAARRAYDTTRQRPTTSLDRLEVVQAEAEQHARTICEALGIPLAILGPEDNEGLVRTFRSFAGT